MRIFFHAATCCWRFVIAPPLVVSTDLDFRSQNFRKHNTKRCRHQVPLVQTCSHQGSNKNGSTNNTLLGNRGAVVFSCNRADEFDSGCEDDTNCACIFKVNCALPKDNRMTRNKIAVQHCSGQMKCSSGLVFGSLPRPRGLQTSASASSRHRDEGRFKPQVETCPVSLQTIQQLPQLNILHRLDKISSTYQRDVARRLGFRFARQRLDDDLHTTTQTRGHSRALRVCRALQKNHR